MYAFLQSLFYIHNKFTVQSYTQEPGLIDLVNRCNISRNPTINCNSTFRSSLNSFSVLAVIYKVKSSTYIDIVASLRTNGML